MAHSIDWLNRIYGIRNLWSIPVRGGGALVAVAVVLLVAGLGLPRDTLAVGNLAPSGGPEFSWAAQAPPSTIELGESFNLYFRVSDVSSNADHGGISVSFPDLTRSGAGSTSYFSNQGSVHTVFYTTGDSNPSYYETGDQIWNSRDEQQPADHLLVESDDSTWPTTAYRVMQLEVTPKETGRFRVYYRFWICGDVYSDCTRAPTGRDVYGLDQQGWAAGAFNIQVEEPREAPEFDWRAWSPPSSVEVGESFRLRFRLNDLSDTADDGSISVSFPALSLSGGDSTHYSSSQGSVRTISYTSGTSKVEYYARGRQVSNSRDSRQSADYLLVEPLDPDWPAGASRTLEVEVTPKEAGEFRVYYRFWLCIDDYSDCNRAPTGRDVESTDQQGFDVGEYRIQVVQPSQPNSPPSVSAVSPLASLLLRAGESVTFTARGTDADNNISQVDWNVNGGWESGQSVALTGSIERSYRHTFSAGGNYRVEAVFTDADGASDSVYWDLHAGQAPVVNGLGCGATRVEVGETVSCRPGIGGGSPTSYLWGSIGGNPWNGTGISFSTHWDTPGRKQIVFEACNSDGCDDGDHWVEVEQRVDPPPRIDRLDCSSVNVKTGETVSCSARLSGGSPSRYQWRSQGGSPSSGNSSSFSARWDSPGTKQISVEVCNDEGCDLSQLAVVVERDIPAVLRVSAADQIIPGASIQLTGTGFPAYSTVESVKVGGRTIPMGLIYSTDGNGEFTVSVTVPSLPPGTHDVEAEISGKVARTSVRIEAPPPPNRPPTVAPVSPLASLQLRVGDTQTFTAEAIDPDENLTRVEWFVNGRSQSGESLNSVGSARKSLDYRVPSTGNFRLTAKFTDSEGQSDSAEWRFEGISPTPPPQLADLGCSSITVSLDEPVTCNPRLSDGDATSYTWSADGGVPWSGRDGTFSTAWGTTGQKEIELEVCNAEGVCDTGSQTITVEDVLYVGAQETFRGELSATADQQLLKVFVSGGRRLRLELTEPPGADFEFSVGLDDIDGQVSRTWGLNSSSRPKSIEIHTTAAGWYTSRIFSKTGSGAFELHTRTDQAYLDLVLDRGASERLSSIGVEKLHCDGSYRRISDHTLIGWDEDAETVRFYLEDFQVGKNPDCMFNFTDGHRWQIYPSYIPEWLHSWSIAAFWDFIHEPRRDWLHSGTINLTYDDVHWSESSFGLSHLASHPYLCIPSCGTYSVEELVYEVPQFLFLDDIDTLFSDESSGTDMTIAGASLGLSAVPPAKAAKLLKILKARPKEASNSLDGFLNWIRRTDIDDPSLKPVWKNLELFVHRKIVAKRISELKPSTISQQIAHADWDKVENVRIAGKSPREAWAAIDGKLKRGEQLTTNEVGLYREFRIAAAAKQSGMILDGHWLRRTTGSKHRITTDLDVVARFPGGEIVVFQSKGSWYQFVDTETTHFTKPGKLKDSLLKESKEAKKEGAEALVIVAEGSPDFEHLLWMEEQGILYMSVSRGVP